MLRAASPHRQSRPTRDSAGSGKKMSLLKKLKGRSSRSIRDAPSPTSSLATTPDSNNGSRSKSPRRSLSKSSSFRKTTARVLRSRRSIMPMTPRSRNKSSKSSAAAKPRPLNALTWLEDDCPIDVLPKIMAYAGPQMIAKLNKTNRFWHDILSDEATWMNLCEELYKWKDGDGIPRSWLEFYRFNPCVPVDYPTVSKALDIVKGTRAEQQRSLRILMRPGTHYLRTAINIEASLNAHIVFETMEIPDCFQPPIDRVLQEQPIPLAPMLIATPPSPQNRRRRGIRSMLCRSANNVEDSGDAQEDESFPEFVEPPLTFLTAQFSPASPPTPPTKAVLVSKSQKQNEPLLRIRRGNCTLRNLELRHVSRGTDIWNGNSAVQIQPPMGPDDLPLSVTPNPVATLERVEIISRSGRGVVNIDGGKLNVRDCYVHDCAATGIYVGGPGSSAVIERTDVMKNGNGNTCHRRGIARGHSGVYLEQGHATISNCNISRNSLTGISVVNTENAFLTMEDSDLMSNGTYQLELPAPDTPARRGSVMRNNNMSTDGQPRSRSGLFN